ncbi:MAG: DUF222 domain-containing protein [Arachnia sp.]
MHQTRTMTSREVIDRMAGLLSCVDVREWDELPETDLVQLLLDVRRFADRVAGLSASLTRIVDLRNAAGIARRMPLHALITLEEYRDGKDATRELAQGRGIAKNPQVARGVLDGTITPDHAQKVAKAIDDLPRGVNRAQVAEIAEILIDEATRCRPSDLPEKAEAVLRRVAPEHVPSVEDEERRVAMQRRAAVRRRSLRFGDDGEGSFWLKGSVPYLEGARLFATLDRMVAAQKRAEQDGPRLRGAQPTREQRYADALTDLGAAAASNVAAASDPAPASNGGAAAASNRGSSEVPAVPKVPAVTVVVTISEADLRERATATGVLASGHKVPAGELRRLLCDANIVPVVLGSRSEILDMGRETRFVTRAQRRALALRDKGCVFPGCAVGEPECHAHHVVPWWCGGVSDLRNLVLLCPHHHGLVEPARLQDDKTSSAWEVVFDPLTGKAEVRPAARCPMRAGPVSAPLPTGARLSTNARLSLGASLPISGSLPMSGSLPTGASVPIGGSLLMGGSLPVGAPVPAPDADEGSHLSPSHSLERGGRRDTARAP